jgi:hypothetical protein
MDEKDTGDNGRGRVKGSYGMEEEQKSNTATISKQCQVARGEPI